MNQAQGAIDTARAAGADRYAPEELRAASAALDTSKQVATERDYRQALNFALDARERAHEAARTSAERMAQVRSEAETLMQSTDNLLRVGQSRARPVAARAPQAVHDAFAQAEKDLQEARAALTRQDFVTARDQARAISERLRDAIVALEEATSPKDRRAPPKRAPR